MKFAAPSRLEAIRAGTTLAAMAASFCTIYALCRWFGTSYQPAIVAAILALGLSRRPPVASGARTLAVPAVLAAIALAAGGVGWLLKTIPILGAAVFTAGLFLSVWLRNFDARARRAGALIALPLVAMLVVPPIDPVAPGGLGLALLMTICAGVVALVWATAIHWVAGKAGLLAPAAVRTPPTRAERRTPGRLSVSTRMALQMAVALALAFAVGFVAFPGHWGWAVLTAFIVCSGARGRGDAAYKGVLRLIGALAGTLVAAVLARTWMPSGALEALAIFAALYVGLWWREVNYAVWACAMTLVLAMLAGSSGLSVGILGVRLEAIVAGAFCAVAAAWFVFPIKTTDVVRGRLAYALAAVDEFVQHAHADAEQKSGKLATFEDHLGELEAVAPPMRWHRRLGDHPEHPARWIDLAAALRERAREYGEMVEPPPARRGAIRRAIGASRLALANHGKPDAAESLPVGAALTKLHETLR